MQTNTIQYVLKLHDYMINLCILKSAIHCKVCLEVFYFLFFFLNDNTNATNSFFLINFIILILFYFLFFFKGNANATNSPFFGNFFFFCKKSTIMCLFLHILIKALFVYIGCWFCRSLFFFSFSLFLNGYTNVTNSLVLRKLYYFDFVFIYLLSSLKVMPLIALLYFLFLRIFKKRNLFVYSVQIL